MSMKKLKLSVFYYLYLAFTLIGSELVYSQDKQVNYYTNHTIEDFLSDNEAQSAINHLEWNRELLESIIFHYTNKARISKGLEQFRYEATLYKAARIHADEMILKDFYSHINPFSQKWKSPKDRIHYFNPNFYTLAENISQNNLLYHQGEALKYSVSFNTKKQEYIFLNETNTAIRNFTYIELAQKIAQQWMDSKAHRKNILNKDFNNLACSCKLQEKSFKSDEPPIIRCVQNFGSLK